MKVDDIVKYRGPALVPLPSDEADLAALAPALRRAGYRSEALAELFGNPLVPLAEVPGYVWRCRRDDTPLARLALLFLLCEEVERASIDEVLGGACVDRLLLRDLLEQREGRLSARVDLYEARGAFVFTDHNVGMTRFSKHVYEPGADSYTCARTTPRRTVARALDLCTGGGMHAVLAAAHADTVVGVDVNDRALGFAQVNAAVNGVKARCRFLRGDLYQALPADAPPFDLIVTNPPWIPTPDDKMQLYRWGGETGEVLTRQIVEGLPRFLAPRGRLAMFVVYPVMGKSSYLERIRGWLGDTTGWGVSLATFTRMSPEAFVASQIAGKWAWQEHVAEFGRWMDMYQRLDIVRIATGMVYVTRLSEGDTGWTLEREMPLPLTDRCDAVERWLDALEAIHAPGWPQGPLRLSPDVIHFGVDARSGEGRVELTAHWPIHLSREETDAVTAVIAGRPLPLDLARSLALRRIIEAQGAG